VEEQMKHASVLRFGGTAAIAVGALYLMVGLTHFLMPRAQLRGAVGITDAFFASLARGSSVFMLHYWLVVATALLTFAVIAAFLSLLREHRTGPLCWAAAVGFFGAALTAIDFTIIAVEAPRLARLYMSAAADARPMLLVFGVPHIDPCFFANGLAGVFALTVNIAALRHRLLPRTLATIGVIGSVLFLLLFAGALAHSPWLIDFAVGLGGLVIGPLWYIWTGFILRSRAKEQAGK
jgi:hypothetical protein